MVCSTAPEPGPAAIAGTAAMKASVVPASHADLERYRMSGLLHEAPLRWNVQRLDAVPAPVTGRLFATAQFGLLSPLRSAVGTAVLTPRRRSSAAASALSSFGFCGT